MAFHQSGIPWLVDVPLHLCLWLHVTSFVAVSKFLSFYKYTNAWIRPTLTQNGFIRVHLQRLFPRFHRLWWPRIWGEHSSVEHVYERVWKASQTGLARFRYLLLPLLPP